MSSTVAIEDVEFVITNPPQSILQAHVVSPRTLTISGCTSLQRAISAANGKLETRFSDACAAGGVDVISFDRSDALVQDSDVEVSLVGMEQDAGPSCAVWVTARQRGGAGKQRRCFSF